MNDLQTVEVSATQPGSKEATIVQADAQLAAAINATTTFDADTDPTLLVTDLLRNSKIVLTCTGPGHEVTVTPVARTQIWFRADDDNTNDIDLTCGSTTETLAAGGFYLVEFDGTANGMIVNTLVTVGTGPFVLITGSTMTGALQVPAGAAATPGLRVGDADTGFYQTAGHLLTAIDGVNVADLLPTGLVFISSAAFSLDIHANAGANIQSHRYSTDATGVNVKMRKARGTKAASTIVAVNDTLGQFTASAYDGAAFQDVSFLRTVVVEPVPAVGSLGSRILALVAPLAAVTPSEIVRLEHATGLSMFGANPVINASRHHVNRSYTVATIPAVGAAGEVIFISDKDSGSFAWSDGTQWRYPLGQALGATEFIRYVSGAPVGIKFGDVSVVPTITAERFQFYTTGGAGRLNCSAESGVAIESSRYSTDASAPGFAGKKYRGTIATPTTIILNDELFSLSAQAYDGSAIRVAGELNFSVIAATPSATDMQARLRTLLCASGSVSRTEIERWDHATGLSMFGANPVIDQSRHIVLRSYTNAGKPAASSNTNKKIFISDYLGGVEVCSDGTDWVVGTDTFIYALSDETTTITTGANKLIARVPYKAKIVGTPRANVNTVSSSGLPTVDLNVNTSTIFSTKLTIDANEKTSVTALTAVVVSSAALADDDELEFDIDVAGTGAKGLKVHLTLKHIL